MKKIYFCILNVLLALGLNAQTPQAIQYQAVVRNSDGNLVKNQKVSYEISILGGSASGASVYTETHVDTTDEFGVSNLLIGQGTPTLNTFAGIDWGDNEYFVKIAIDVYGGTSYMTMGTTQLMSVPYALHADDAYTLDGKTSSYFANATHSHSEYASTSHGHSGYASTSHTHSEYANKSHSHSELSLVPVLQANVRFDATCSYGCYNVESIAWNSSLKRYEIEITDVYYSIDDISLVTIAGDAGSCPAGASARQSSVSGKLLVYIVNSAGTNIQCSFDVIAFSGQ